MNKLPKIAWLLIGTATLLFFLLFFFIIWRPMHKSGMGIDPGDHRHDNLQEYFTCPMHPKIIQDKPGNCPICGMRLVKKTRGEDGASHEDGGEIPQDIRTISLDPLKQVLANVATTRVERKRLIKTIRTVGIVAFDTELFVASQEYLSALKVARSSSASGFYDIGKQGRASLQAAKDKLKLMGLGGDEIAKIDKTGKIDRSLYFPEKYGDLWVNAEIFELDRKWIRLGSEVELTFEAYPGETFQGKLVSLTPVIQFPTRTFKARIRVSNPGKPLEPEMFARAKLKMDAGEHLAIPAGAVIDTGERRAVWAALTKDRFALKQVSLGDKVDGYFIVLDGLETGDLVVSQGGFLLDSEAELKSFGMQGMPGMEGMDMKGHQH